MKFGVRQIANVVFRANKTTVIGDKTFQKGQPVFYLDTAKTSSIESSATTVYATGGRGNTRLVTWEGEKTLTFNVEDALLSPISFAILSGAGVIKGVAGSNKIVHFHQTTAAVAVGGEIDLSGAITEGDVICETAPLYVMKIDEYGDLTGEISTGWEVVENTLVNNDTTINDSFIVDYYVNKSDSKVTELQIDAGSFGGSYYVEADTLFRTQNDNRDYPANITFPNVKIQSNFTFSMAATGDPSTFSFVMDAMPGNTYFNKNKKVLCAIQIADETTDTIGTVGTVFPHPAETDNHKIVEATNDSVSGDTESAEAVDYAERATRVTFDPVVVTANELPFTLKGYYLVNGKTVNVDLDDFEYSDTSDSFVVSEHGVVSLASGVTVSATVSGTITATHKELSTLTDTFNVTIKPAT